MDWNDLRFAVAVAETGSTLAAAQRLKVSQPTVARRIAALEDAIGLSLFERLPSGYRLTVAGEALLPAARSVESAADGFIQAADAHRRRVAGFIRLAAPPVIAELYVVHALMRFRELYPDIQVEILAMDGPLDVESGDADVAIQVGERPTRGQLVARRLARDTLTLFCSQAYADAHGVPRSPEELASHMILLGAGPIADAPVYRWLRDAAPRAKTGYPATSVSAHIASVRAGAGIGVLPRRLYGDDPDLVPCFDAPVEYGVETWLVAPERLRNEPAVRALLDFIGGYRGEPPSHYRSRNDR